MQVRRLLLLGLCVGAASAAALAEPYWISYEATDRYPEEEGWERLAYGGGAVRSLEGGALVLDGRAASGIADLYVAEIPSPPDEGETFVVQWRMWVSDVTGRYDPGLRVSFSPQGVVLLGYSEDGVYSQLEGGQRIADFQPGVFHDFALSTSDVVGYDFWIDGQLVHTGRFAGPQYYEELAWGDAMLGATSLSRWDFVRFGTVPEPATGALLGLGALLALTPRARTKEVPRWTGGGCWLGARRRWRVAWRRRTP
jgi:hypothetical protein